MADTPIDTGVVTPGTSTTYDGFACANDGTAKVVRIAAVGGDAYFSWVGDDGDAPSNDFMTVPEGGERRFLIVDGVRWKRNARFAVAVESGGTYEAIVERGIGATLVLEAPVVRTDLASTEIIAAATAFTAGTIVWSSAVDMRDHREISVWFTPTSLGSNTAVSLYAQWGDDGSTITLADGVGLQQTDFLVAQGTDGSFKPKDYAVNLTTSTGELVVNTSKLLSYPKKGGSFRIGVKGNSASGTFGIRSQRLA